MTSLHPPRHLQRVAPLRIAMIAPVSVDAGDIHADDHADVARRLGAEGHAVTLYGPRALTKPEDPAVQHVELPELSGRRLRAALATAHVVSGRRYDVVLTFGTATARFVPLLRARGAAVGLHVDGLDADPEQRTRRARRTGRRAEQIAVREADAIIAGDRSTAHYYEDEFDVPAEVIRPGSPLLRDVPADAIERLGVVPGAFHLLAVIGREDHLAIALEGYRRSSAALPLVVAGAGLTDALRALAASDTRIRLLEDVADPRVREQLAFHAVASVHGDADGGRPGTLLQAMSAGTAAIAWHTVGNREVAGTAGSFFSTPAQLAYELEQVERYPFRFRDIGELMQERVRARHDPDATAEAYAALATKLSRGWSTRGMSTGRRIIQDAAAPVRLESVTRTSPR
jgi:glycosyltransferase involved in cell wall biosynthesis